MAGYSRTNLPVEAEEYQRMLEVVFRYDQAQTGPQRAALAAALQASLSELPPSTPTFVRPLSYKTTSNMPSTSVHYQVADAIAVRGAGSTAASTSTAGASSTSTSTTATAPTPGASSSTGSVDVVVSRLTMNDMVHTAGPTLGIFSVQESSSDQDGPLQTELKAAFPLPLVHCYSVATSADGSVIAAGGTKGLLLVMQMGKPSHSPGAAGPPHHHHASSSSGSGSCDPYTCVRSWLMLLGAPHGFHSGPDMLNSIKFGFVGGKERIIIASQDHHLYFFDLPDAVVPTTEAPLSASSSDPSSRSHLRCSPASGSWPLCTDLLIAPQLSPPSSTAETSAGTTSTRGQSIASPAASSHNPPTAATAAALPAMHLDPQLLMVDNLDELAALLDLEMLPFRRRAQPKSFPAGTRFSYQVEAEEIRARYGQRTVQGVLHTEGPPPSISSSLYNQILSRWNSNNLETHLATRSMGPFSSPLNFAVASPDGQWLGVTLDKPYVMLINTSTPNSSPKKLHFPVLTRDSPFVVQPACQNSTFNPSSTLLAAACDHSSSVYCWSVATGQLLMHLSEHLRPCIALRFMPVPPPNTDHPQGVPDSMLVYAQDLGHVHVVDVTNPHTLQSLPVSGHTSTQPLERINGIACTASGTVMAAGWQALHQWQLLVSWSPSSHRHFPPAFKAAARTLITAAHSPSSGEAWNTTGLWSLPSAVLYRILEIAAFPLRDWIPETDVSRAPGQSPHIEQIHPLPDDIHVA